MRRLILVKSHSRKMHLFKIPVCCKVTQDLGVFSSFRGGIIMAGSLGVVKRFQNLIVVKQKSEESLSLRYAFLARHFGRITPLRMQYVAIRDENITRQLSECVCTPFLVKNRGSNRDFNDSRFFSRRKRTRDFRLLFTLALSRHNPGHTLKNGEFYDPPVPPPRKHACSSVFTIFISCIC